MRRNSSCFHDTEKNSLAFDKTILTCFENHTIFHNDSIILKQSVTIIEAVKELLPPLSSRSNVPLKSPLVKKTSKRIPPSGGVSLFLSSVCSLNPKNIIIRAFELQYKVKTNIIESGGIYLYMNNKKAVVLGGGVLGTQIGLICAFHGYDTTFWLRSEGSVGRTQPKIDRYSALMLEDLAAAKPLIGNPMGRFMYPKGLIKDWDSMTPEKLDALYETGRKNMTEKVHIELDRAAAVKDAYIVIESMSEDPQAKIDVYTQFKDLLDPDTILVTNSSTLLPSMFAEYTGRPEKYLSLHFANTIWKNNTAEVMGHAGTGKEYYDEVVKFAADIGMVPLLLHKEQPGYILNSMLVPFLSAAQGLWANGVADPETIDKTWQLATGAPAGPFQILDIVGLETAYNINQMKPAAQQEGSLENRVGKLLKEKIDKGETGVNAGKGFYDYTKK